MASNNAGSASVSEGASSVIEVETERGVLAPWSTEMLFSAIDSALSEEKTQELIGVIPDNISPVLQPLISELNQVKNISENVNFERLEPLLIRLMKSCYGGKNFTLQVANYLASNNDVLHGLSFLARYAMKGKGEAPIKCGGGKEPGPGIHCLRMLTTITACNDSMQSQQRGCG